MYYYTRMKKYLSLTLSVIAFVAVIILMGTHFEYDGWQTIFFAAIALLAGYWFGKWTCHLHKHQSGFWITIGVFVLLNLMHSMIDGASIGGVSSFASGLAIISHEFARQPALYMVLLGMITPFVAHRHYRLLIVLLAVTGVWFLGAYLGYEFFVHVNQAEWLEPIADTAVFLFLGDILHHLHEEYRKLRNMDDCCHS